MIALALVGAAPAAVQPAADDVIGAARASWRRDHRAELEAQAAACRQRGGDFDYRGLGLAPVCNVRTSDAGRQCQSRADCEGLCVAEPPQVDWAQLRPGQPLAGHCTPETAHFGCFVAVEHGRAGTPICVD